MYSSEALLFSFKSLGDFFVYSWFFENVMVSFWLAPRSRHVSHLIRNFRRQQYNTTGRIYSWEHLPAISQLFPNHFSFWGINGLRILFLLRNLLFQRRDSHLEQDGRSNRPHLIFAYIHGVCYAVRASHISTIAITPTSGQTITEGSRNYSRNQERNPDRYEGITTCRSCDYWNAYDPHYQ